MDTENFYVNNAPVKDFFDAISRAAEIAKTGVRDGVVIRYEKAEEEPPRAVTVAVIRAVVR